jgi:GT2 family glycosyltransferase
VDCLSSLREEYGQPFTFHVIVVDNKSDDNSVEVLASAIKKNDWENWVTLLPLPKNGGFSYGNNRAFEVIAGKTIPDYILLLNPDTVVRRGACGALVRFLENNPKTGITGSRLEDPDGTPQVSAFRDHSIISEFLSGLRLGVVSKILQRWLVAQTPVPEIPMQTDWISGASMMIRKEVFEDVGLLDEKFFMYFEEVDFCIRAREKGWECWHVPESRVIHLVGAASGISDNRKKASRRPAYWFESRRRFFLKHYGKLTLCGADTFWILGYFIWRIRRLLQRKPDLDPPYFLRDFYDHSVFCKGFDV